MGGRAPGAPPPRSANEEYVHNFGCACTKFQEKKIVSVTKWGLQELCQYGYTLHVFQLFDDLLFQN